MAILHRGGTGEAGRLGVISGKIIASGAATNVMGGTLTITWGSGGSGVLTYGPAFKSAPNIICSPAGTSSVLVLQTGVGPSTAGLWMIATDSAASGADFNVNIMGVVDL